MLKKGVIIGAGSDAVHTIEKAREHGVYVIALDGNPKAEGFKYADESISVDISDQECVCRVIEKVKPDFVIPIPIGRYLSTTGYVNEKFGFKGIKYDATLCSTDKYLFHKKLEEARLRPVQMCLVNKGVKREELAVAYPAIMKPRYGSGSRDVFYITCDEELDAVYEKVLSVDDDFILEQAVEGIEYSIDGAVIDGKLSITLLRKKIITPLPVRQPISSFSVVKMKENQKLLSRVLEHMKDVVKVLEYNDCLLNADLIINDEDVFVIEMAPRPSGHNLHNVFVPLATDIDIAEEYIKFLLNKEFRFETNEIRQLQIRFFDFENKAIKKVPTLEELKENSDCNIVLWNCNIRAGDYMHEVKNGHSIMGRGFFVIEGNNENDLLKQSEWILAQFE